jgi:hypothetical protein
MSYELEDVQEIDEDKRGKAAIRPVALRNAVGRMREVLVESLTEEEKCVLDDFDRFRQEHPFDLRSLTDIESEQ